MASGRMLQRKISSNKDLPRLIKLVDERHGQPHGAYAALLFTWTIAHLDAEGRCNGDPDVVKGNVMPRVAGVTAEAVGWYLSAAHELGLILYYEADGDMWIAYPGFERNQIGLRKDRESPVISPEPIKRDNPPVSINSGVEQMPLRTDSGGTPEELLPKLNEKKVKERKGARSNSADGNPEAVALLAELSEARKRVDPSARTLSPVASNLKEISARLAEGATTDDIRHVIAVCEAECKADQKAFEWFNAATPFLPKSFAIKLARKVSRAPPNEPRRDSEDMAELAKRMGL